ncbi:quaternary amine uptake ABC transporter (QAT) family, periplasmic amine-binding protein [Klebsiella michiganensis]|nr:quaternary amine uptake ABC transporter (QAT) family, periplasmic amine-binding protein [Klebsiella michiganensis]
MKQLFSISAHRRRLRLSVFTAGLLSLSFNALAQDVTIGGANFTESSILANIYASALKKNDIAVKTRLNLGNREIIIPALQSGEIDIVPEYLGALLNYYDGKTLATSQSDVSAELAKALPADFTLLTPSPASSITAWARARGNGKKISPQQAFRPAARGTSADYRRPAGIPGARPGPAGP